MVRIGDDGSDNFIDRTGRGGLGFGGGGGGGNMLGCLLPLVASKFGIVGVLVLLLGYCAFSSLGGGGGGLLPTTGSSAPAPSGQSTLSAEDRRLLSGVLASTERVWGEIFQRAGGTYQAPQMVAYSNTDQSGCGVAQAAMGPFYCPTDQRIYIDPEFFDELNRRFRAPGDFAQAYVIAHEVGHHIQYLEGTLDRAQAAQAQSSRAQGNQIQVGVELQAIAMPASGRPMLAKRQGSILEPGDIEEGMRAAEAIGDDTLQRQAQGAVVPESSPTHVGAADGALRRACPVAIRGLQLRA